MSKRLDPKQKEEIRRLIREDKLSIKEIAARVGCSNKAVYATRAADRAGGTRRRSRKAEIEEVLSHRNSSFLNVNHYGYQESMNTPALHERSSATDERSSSANR